MSNSGERAEARAHAVFASDLLLRDDPVSHLRYFLPDLYREDRQQRYRLDLNQDLSKFRGRNERRESKWDLDSRNVRYGIFVARSPSTTASQISAWYVSVYWSCAAWASR